MLLYVGHATNLYTRPPRTELCLRDGRVAVDDLLPRTYRGAAQLVLLLDACQSADVDVRRSPAPAAVLSASPDAVETMQHGGTALGGRLVPALACADADGDGWIDDRELLDALTETVGQPVLGVTPVPRLRRQAPRALPVAAAQRDPACPPPPPPARDGPPDESVEVRARWSSERNRLVMSAVMVVWHPGPVGDTLVTSEGHRYAGDQLEPVWCTDRSFGQCFEVRPPPARAEETR